MDETILRATVELLSEVGYVGVTVADVARRAGVSKPAIYRRWSQKSQLVVEAMVTQMRPGKDHESGSAASDLLALTEQLLSLLTLTPFGRVLPGLVAEMAADAKLAASYRDLVIKPNQRQWRAAVERGIASGELCPDTDIDLVLNTLRRTPLLQPPDHRRPPRPGYARAAVDLVLARYGSAPSRAHRRLTPLDSHCSTAALAPPLSARPALSTVHDTSDRMDMTSKESTTARAVDDNTDTPTSAITSARRLDPQLPDNDGRHTTLPAVPDEGRADPRVNREERVGQDRQPVLAPGRAPFVWSGALVVVAAIAAGFSFFVPSILTGAPVAIGCLRGTALVVLVVGLPVLVAAMTATAHGSARGLVVWLGTLGYLLYQAVMFCFAAPVNTLFLFYIAYLGFAIWSIVSLLRSTDLIGYRARVSPRLPARFIAAFALTLAVLNAYAWLASIIPALLSREPSSLVQDTGLITNPVYVQDLAIWLPLLITSALATWRRETWGMLITGAMVAMFVLESIGIAADQWFGSLAAPLSRAASMSMVPTFTVAALITAVPLFLYCRNLDRAL